MDRINEFTVSYKLFSSLRNRRFRRNKDRTLGGRSSCRVPFPRISRKSNIKFDQFHNVNATRDRGSPSTFEITPYLVQMGGVGTRGRPTNAVVSYILCVYILVLRTIKLTSRYRCTSIDRARSFRNRVSYVTVITRSRFRYLLD